MRKIRTLPQEELEKFIDNITQLFAMYGINAIVDFPDSQTISFFNTKPGRDRVLEHARIETTADEIILSRKAEQWAMQKNNIKNHTHEPKQTPSYIN